MRPAPRIVLASVGSLGDLHPFIAIGLALNARGAEAVLAVPEDHLAKCRAAGLEAHAILPSFEEVGRATGLPEDEVIARVMASGDFLVRRVLLPGLADSAARLLRIAEGADAVAATGFTFAGPIAAERLRLPLVHVVLQPLSWFSVLDPPSGAGARVLARPGAGAVGRGWNRVLLRAVRAFAKARYGGAVDRARAAHGLPPGRTAPLVEPGTRPALSIGTYSPAFAALPADAQAPAALTGWPWYDADEDGTVRLDAELAAFLDGGPPPLVVSLGSFVPYSGTDLYARAAEIAARVSMRAVLLTGEADAPPPTPNVIARRYAPHSLLFPRAAVVVHHGGIGSTGQALRVGRPQLVAPFMGDQPDNAARVARSGVGLTVGPRRFARDAPALIGRLLGEPGFSGRAAELGRLVAAEDGAGAAADAVLRLVTHSSR